MAITSPSASAVVQKRLRTLPTNRLLSKAFQTDQDLHINGYKSWYSCLEKTLRSAGIKENFNFLDSETVDKLLTRFYSIPIIWLSSPVLKGLLMRVHYPKLRNIVHTISL